MNQPITRPVAAPIHIVDLYNAMLEGGADVPSGPVTLMPAEGMNASFFILEGKYNNRNFSVRVSHNEEEEELLTAVFIDSGKPLGQDTLTRHYQPGKYLGKDANGASNSRRFQLAPTRRAREILHLDILDFLNNGKLPYKAMEEWNDFDAKEA